MTQELSPLPPSTDEYWQYSNVEQQQLREMEECDHFFIYRSAVEVECASCNIGFFLSPGWRVEEGKLESPLGDVV